MLFQLNRIVLLYFLILISCRGVYACLKVRATSHTRLRAHDYYTSSTLIGGKGGAGPSSLHTTLEGPMEYVNANWMSKSIWIMFHGHLGYF